MDNKQLVMVKSFLAHLIVTQCETTREASQQAMVLIEDAILLGGETAATLDTRALAHMGLKKYTEAMNDIQVAIMKDPNRFYYYHMSLIGSKAKNEALAKDALNSAIAAGLTAAQLSTYDRKQFTKIARLSGIKVKK